MNQIDLQAKNAVVTGAARGIGFAIVERLLASGARCSLWDLDREALVRVAQFRRETSSTDDMPALYDRVLRTVGQAADLTGRLKETPP